MSWETSFKSGTKIKTFIDLREFITSITSLKDNLKDALQTEVILDIRSEMQDRIK